jgi:hypothetical protein
MRKTVLIFAMIAICAAMFSSCASYRGSERGGCKATQGYVGYGSR